MGDYSRDCPLLRFDGGHCIYVAPSKRAFKRHVETKHGVKLSIRGRGPTAREVFTLLTEAEARASRINVSNRQGGRGPDRARLREEFGCPAPPRPCCRPPTVQNAPPGYLPAGYRSPNSDKTSSSLSLGGLTNDVDADLEDIDLSSAADLAGPDGEWMSSFPDLTMAAKITMSCPDDHMSTTLTSDHARHCPPPPTAIVMAPIKTFTCSATQVEPSRADAATAARPLPQPLLSAPSMPTSELARRVEQSLHSHPSASTDAILDDVRLSLPVSIPASESRAAGLAIDFGAELLRLSADRLLRELQARFEHIAHVDQHMTETMLRYIFEELDIWRRRPERPASGVAYDLL